MKLAESSLTRISGVFLCVGLALFWFLSADFSLPSSQGEMLDCPLAASRATHWTDRVKEHGPLVAAILLDGAAVLGLLAAFLDSRRARARFREGYGSAVAVVAILCHVALYVSPTGLGLALMLLLLIAGAAILGDRFFSSFITVGLTLLALTVGLPYLLSRVGPTSSWAAIPSGLSLLAGLGILSGFLRKRAA